MNPIIVAVVLMLTLALLRVNVVFSLFVGALCGGLLAGMDLQSTLLAFKTGIANGAEIALSYALLGAFAMAIAHSGIPTLLAEKMIARITAENQQVNFIKFSLIILLIVISMASQNIIPIHIAFIPLIIPPLLLVMDKLSLDRRMIACILTFGLVNTYLFIPYGFGDIYINQMLLRNIDKAGMNVDDVNTWKAMALPALGMLLGLLIAIFFSYRKPRAYRQIAVSDCNSKKIKVSSLRIVVAFLAIVVAFVAQLWTNSMIVGAVLGCAIFMGFGVVKWNEADEVFNDGIRMMAMIGFIIITAQGFAEVMKATGAIEPLVIDSAKLFANSKSLAALTMLFVGLLITMGIGSSFSTLPIIAVIYVPLCLQMNFSPLATVAIIGTAGVLGDAGSPASDSTLGPTSGLNADGQHNHIRDSVIPTFLHYNIPLILFGWLAAIVL